MFQKMKCKAFFDDQNPKRTDKKNVRPKFPNGQIIKKCPSKQASFEQKSTRLLALLTQYRVDSE